MFHVELKRGRFAVTRLFNISEAELQARIVGPLRAGGTIEVDDREWPPDDLQVTILSGDALEPSRLGMGRGWSEATRSATDVTERLLAEPSAASVIHAGNEDLHRAVVAQLDAAGVEARDWNGSVVRAFEQAQTVVIVASQDPRVLVAIGHATALYPKRTLIIGPLDPAVGIETISVEQLGERLRQAEPRRGLP